MYLGKFIYKLYTENFSLIYYTNDIKHTHLKRSKQRVNHILKYIIRSDGFNFLKPEIHVEQVSSLTIVDMNPLFKLFWLFEFLWLTSCQMGLGCPCLWYCIINDEQLVLGGWDASTPYFLWFAVLVFVAVPSICVCSLESFYTTCPFVKLGIIQSK